MPFRIVKSFILENMRTQQKRIDKHNSRLNEEITNIRNCKTEVKDMKQKPINFNNKKTCNLCRKELSLPTLHFMCKHSYCDGCVDNSTGIRKCPRCHNRKCIPFALSFYSTAFANFDVIVNTTENKDLFDIRATFAQNRYDTENFFRELKGAGIGSSNKTKFDVVASYCSKDLFAGLNEPEPSSSLSFISAIEESKTR